MFINKSDIIKAWTILRKSTEAQSIPDETLDFIKNVSLKELEKLEKNIFKIGDLVRIKETCKNDLISLYKNSSGMSGIYPQYINYTYVVHDIDGNNLIVIHNDISLNLNSERFIKF